MNGVSRKVGLLTGAGGRLGEAFCRMFSAHYDIAAVIRNRHPSAPSQREWLIDPLAPGQPVAENQGATYVIRADLREEAELDRVVDVALARFGRIDFLLNVAAVSCWAPMLEGDRLYRQFHEQMDLNVFVPLRLSALVARKFWKNRDVENRHANRCIVNVSSTSGLYIYPDKGQSVYSASKAALNYLTLHMANEYSAIGIRVNALAPTSFPSLVPTDAVSNALMRIVETTATGRILVLDTSGEHWQ